MTTAGHLSHKLRTVAKPIEAAEPLDHESRWTVASRVVLLVGLFAAPYSFGAVQPWAWGTLICVSAIALMLWGVGVARTRSSQFPWTPLYLPWIAVLLWVAMQWTTGRTLDPIATRESLLKGCGYFVVFLAASAGLTSASERTWRGFGLAATLYTFAMAVFGIVQFFVAPGKLYGVIEPRFGGWVFGPYVNHNHFAGLMELLVPLVCAFGFSQWRQVRILAWFTAAIAFTAVLVSGSRGGSVCLGLAIAGVIAVASLASERTIGKWNIFALTAAVVGVLCFAAYVIPPQVSNRYEQTLRHTDASLQDRVAMSRDTWRIIKDHPLTGVGLGALEVAYPRYQSWTSDALVDHVHNDYFELAAEIGLPGSLMALLAVGMFLWLAWPRLPLGADSSISWMQLGAAFGVCSLLAHSVMDFNLHIPANAAWFAFMAAAATVAHRTGRHADYAASEGRYLARHHEVTRISLN